MQGAKLQVETESEVNNEREVQREPRQLQMTAGCSSLAFLLLRGVELRGDGIALAAAASAASAAALL